MRYPLWSPSNASEVSSLFVVYPGKCVVLSAVGLADTATQTEASFRTKQMVCVERLLYEPMKQTTRRSADDCGCDWIIDVSARMAIEVSGDAVSVGGCHWTMDSCDNVKIVGLPGTYRLRLNDPTAGGVAQVYAELYDASQIPAQLFGMFFQ